MIHCRIIALTRAFHSWAAVALTPKQRMPEAVSEGTRKLTALAERVHALELQRYADTLPSNHLQDL